MIRFCSMYRSTFSGPFGLYGCRYFAFCSRIAASSSARVSCASAFPAASIATAAPTRRALMGCDVTRRRVRPLDVAYAAAVDEEPGRHEAERYPVGHQHGGGGGQA